MNTSHHHLVDKKTEDDILLSHHHECVDNENNDDIRSHSSKLSSCNDKNSTITLTPTHVSTGRIRTRLQSNSRNIRINYSDCKNTLGRPPISATAGGEKKYPKWAKLIRYNPNVTVNESEISHVNNATKKSKDQNGDTQKREHELQLDLYYHSLNILNNAVHETYHHQRHNNRYNRHTNENNTRGVFSKKSHQAQVHEQQREEDIFLNLQRFVDSFLPNNYADIDNIQQNIINDRGETVTRNHYEKDCVVIKKQKLNHTRNKEEQRSIRITNDPTLLPIAILKSDYGILDRSFLNQTILQKQFILHNPRSSPKICHLYGSQRDSDVCRRKSTTLDLMNSILDQCCEGEIYRSDDSPFQQQKYNYHISRKNKPKSCITAMKMLVEWGTNTTLFDSIVIMIEDPENINPTTFDEFIEICTQLRYVQHIPISIILTPNNVVMDNFSMLSRSSLGRVVVEEFFLPSADTLYGSLMNELFVESSSAYSSSNNIGDSEKIHNETLPFFIEGQFLHRLDTNFSQYHKSISTVASQIKVALAHHFFNKASLISAFMSPTFIFQHTKACHLLLIDSQSSSTIVKLQHLNNDNNINLLQSKVDQSSTQLLSSLVDHIKQTQNVHGSFLSSIALFKKALEFLNSCDRIYSSVSYDTSHYKILRYFLTKRSLSTHLNHSIDDDNGCNTDGRSIHGVTSKTILLDEKYDHICQSMFEKLKGLHRPEQESKPTLDLLKIWILEITRQLQRIKDARMRDDMKYVAVGRKKSSFLKSLINRHDCSDVISMVDADNDEVGNDMSMKSYDFGNEQDKKCSITTFDDLKAIVEKFIQPSTSSNPISPLSPSCYDKLCIILQDLYQSYHLLYQNEVSSTCQGGKNNQEQTSDFSENSVNSTKKDNSLLKTEELQVKKVKKMAHLSIMRTLNYIMNSICDWKHSDNHDDKIIRESDNNTNQKCRQTPSQHLVFDKEPFLLISSSNIINNCPVLAHPRLTVSFALGNPSVILRKRNDLCEDEYYPDACMAFYVMEERLVSKSEWFELFCEKMRNDKKRKKNKKKISNSSDKDIDRETLLPRFIFAISELMHCGLVSLVQTRGLSKEEHYERTLIWTSFK